ncbi:MAG TPA: winged helix-turn-helix transcriptional regulator [Sphingomicrobium sp.]|nr:winged helix-turn-helix transcriptional regulator [Sphingomicrobium sp.]
MRQNEEIRRYEDACGLAHAVELLGERWAILVLRELMLGPRRFSELKGDLAGISANVLTQRLGELELRGLVRKTRLPPPASVQVYEATDWAMDAAPILCELGRWAFRSPRHDPTQRVSAVAIMLSMRTNFDSALAGDLAAEIAFRFGDSRYFATVRDGRIMVGSGEPAAPDVTITCAPDDLKPVLYGGAPVETLSVQGDIGIAQRFVRAFSLPPKVESDA